MTVNSISEGQVFLELYYQKLAFYDFIKIYFAFYDLHMDIDKLFHP